MLNVRHRLHRTAQTLITTRPRHPRGNQRFVRQGPHTTTPMARTRRRQDRTAVMPDAIRAGRCRGPLQHGCVGRPQSSSRNPAGGPPHAPVSPACVAAARTACGRVAVKVARPAMYCLCCETVQSAAGRGRLSFSGVCESSSGWAVGVAGYAAGSQRLTASSFWFSFEPPFSFGSASSRHFF